MLYVYVYTLGILLVIMGIVEIFIPKRVFHLWKIWISHRYFFMHGIALIAAGFPLTCVKRGGLGTAVFLIGLILVFTGPFLLLYADRMKKIFITTTQDMPVSSIRALIYLDAVVRSSAGLILILGGGLVI